MLLVIKARSNVDAVVYARQHGLEGEVIESNQSQFFDDEVFLSIEQDNAGEISKVVRWFLDDLGEPRRWGIGSLMFYNFNDLSHAMRHSLDLVV